MSRPDANRRRIALERSRERRFYEEMDKLERDHTRAASASTSYPSHRIDIGGGGPSASDQYQQHQHYSVDSNRSGFDANYSSSSAPRSESGPTPIRTGHPQQQQQRNHSPSSYQRSPLEFHGQHVSFLPPHVIESLRPYYKNAAETMPQVDEKDGRPRPPSFVFAPKHLDSSNLPASATANTTFDFSSPSLGTNTNSHHQQAGTSSSYSPPGQRPTTRDNNNNFSTSRYTQGGYDDERGNVASSTQTNFDPNAKVSYVDISASNAVLQRRVERLEQQLEESIQQKEKLNQIIKSMSYSIVPPLSFLPKEFYEKNKSVIDTCADYAILYRTALRATPNVGGDLDAMEKKIDEQSKEHLMDRVVCLTSEVMSLRKLVADMERVNAMSP